MTARTAFIFISLVVFIAILTTARVALASHNRMLPVESETLASFFQQLLIAMWVYLDRRDRRLGLPYEFEAYVFFAWPVALPYYLVKSRGARGILLFAAFFALYVLPSVVAVSVRLLR